MENNFKTLFVIRTKIFQFCYEFKVIFRFIHLGISFARSFFRNRSLQGQCFNIVFLSFQDWVNKFEKPNTAPNSLQPSTTVLSPYVMFGCLSARLFYHRLSDIYARVSNQNNLTEQFYIQAFLSGPVKNATAYIHLTLTFW